MLYIAIAESGVLRWSPRTQPEPQPWLKTDVEVDALALDPSGTRLAWAGDDVSVLLDAGSRAELHRLEHEGRVASLVLGSERMTSIDGRNGARSYDMLAGTAQPQREVDTLHAISVAGRSGGNVLAIGGYGSIEVRGGAATLSIAMPPCREQPSDLGCARWAEHRVEEFGDEDSQPASYVESSPDWLVHDVEFGPGGQTLAAGRSDGVVLVVDLEAGKVVERFETDPQGALVVVFSPDGRSLAVGGKSGRLHVIARSDESTTSVQAHEHAIEDVAWSSTGLLATAGYDGVAVWRLGPAPAAGI